MYFAAEYILVSTRSEHGDIGLRIFLGESLVSGDALEYSHIEGIGQSSRLFMDSRITLEMIDRVQSQGMKVEAWLRDRDIRRRPEILLFVAASRGFDETPTWVAYRHVRAPNVRTPSARANLFL